MSVQSEFLKSLFDELTARGISEEVARENVTKFQSQLKKKAEVDGNEKIDSALLKIPPASVAENIYNMLKAEGDSDAGARSEVVVIDTENDTVTKTVREGKDAAAPLVRTAEDGADDEDAKEASAENEEKEEAEEETAEQTSSEESAEGSSDTHENEDETEDKTASDEVNSENAKENEEESDSQNEEEASKIAEEPAEEAAEAENEEVSDEAEDSENSKNNEDKEDTKDEEEDDDDSLDGLFNDDDSASDKTGEDTNDGGDESTEEDEGSEDTASDSNAAESRTDEEDENDDDLKVFQLPGEDDTLKEYEPGQKRRVHSAGVHSAAQTPPGQRKTVRRTTESIDLFDDEEAKKNNWLFYVFAVILVPIVFVIGAVLFAVVLALWLVLAVVSTVLIVAVFGISAIGALLSLLGIIFGLIELIGGNVPGAMFEIGLALTVGSAVLFVGIIVYNIAVRFVPFIIKKLGVLLILIFKMFGKAFRKFKKLCASI